MIRVHGDLRPLPDYDALTPADTDAARPLVLSPEQWAASSTTLEIDLAYDIPGVSRFRVNCFQQRNAYGAVMRAIPHIIKPLHELGIPDADRALRPPAARPRARHRPHRLGQDDDAGQPARPRQLASGATTS